MSAVVSNAFDEAATLFATLAGNRALQAAIADAADRALTVVRGGGKLLFAGNGGSAADAQHLAAEYVGRFKFDRPGLPAIALTTDTSILTAVGNDHGFETIFARQVQALGRAGDLLFLSSTSGRSPNVLHALNAAREMDIGTIVLTGAHLDQTGLAPDLVLAVPSSVTARIQEAHLLIGHTICECVEQGMFGT
jgi:D-sedoheptulose 7-phosphate isomerase